MRNLKIIFFIQKNVFSVFKMFSGNVHNSLQRLCSCFFILKILNFEFNYFRAIND